MIRFVFLIMYVFVPCDLSYRLLFRLLRFTVEIERVNFKILEHFTRLDSVQGIFERG